MRPDAVAGWSDDLYLDLDCGGDSARAACSAASWHSRYQRVGPGRLLRHSSASRSAPLDVQPRVSATRPASRNEPTAAHIASRRHDDFAWRACRAELHAHLAVAPMFK